MKKDGEKRKCIVSGKVLEKNLLLRFTVLPDGHLVPDFKKKLPGTGIYVTANRDMLSAAVAKNLFSKTLKQTVRIAPDFVQTIEQLLKNTVWIWFPFPARPEFFVPAMKKCPN